MAHDEPQLADIGRRIAMLPAQHQKPPKVWLPWTSTADVSLCISPPSEQLSRVFDFASLVVRAATGERFPDGCSKDAITFIAKQYPRLQRERVAEPVFHPRQPVEELLFVPLAAAADVMAPTPTPPVAASPQPAIAVAHATTEPAPEHLVLQALCGRMATTNVLQASQLELHGRLLDAAARSGFHARRAMVTAWNTFSPAERAMLPAVGPLLQAEPTAAVGAAVNHDAVITGGGGVVVAAVAPPARAPVAVPGGLSPANAYYLVSGERVGA